METVPRGLIGRHLYLYGVWEIVGTRLFNVLLDPGMRFVDIGANIGYYSLLAARLVGRSGSVYSFEPHAESRSRLKHNIRINRLENIQVRSEAVAQQTGTVDFFPVSQRENEGQSSMLRGEGTQQTAVTVPSISLDDFVSQLPEHRVD